MRISLYGGALVVVVLLLTLRAAPPTAATGQESRGACCASPAAVVDTPEIGKRAPEFQLTGTDGKPYRLSDCKDKIVVLEWFNQDCPFTRRYMPTMKALASKYVAQGVVWLAIDSTHYMTPARNTEAIRKHGIVYPILMDTDGKVGRAYGAQTTPHMFVINKGVVAYMGAIDNKGDRNYVDEAITAVLAGKEAPLAKTKPFGCSVKYRKP